MGIAKEQVDGSNNGSGCCPADQTPFIYLSGLLNFSNVDEPLRYLLAKVNPVTINLTGGGIFEIGQNGGNTPALQNVVLNWSTNKTLTYIKIMLGLTVIASTDPLDLPFNIITILDITTTHIAANLSANSTYTIMVESVDDPTDIASDSVTYQFSNRVFWGNSSLLSDDSLPLTETQVESIFSTELRNDRNMTKTLTLANEYIYFALPTSFGAISPAVPNITCDTPEFIVSGFSNNAWTTYQLSITNVWGYAQNYYIIRSTYLQIATHTVEILN